MSFFTDFFLWRLFSWLEKKAMERERQNNSHVHPIQNDGFDYIMIGSMIDENRDTDDHLHCDDFHDDIDSLDDFDDWDDFDDFDDM